MRKLWNQAFLRKILVRSGPSAQAEAVYEEPFAALLDPREGTGSHKSTMVELIDRYANRGAAVLEAEGLSLR